MKNMNQMLLEKRKKENLLGMKTSNVLDKIKNGTWKRVDLKRK